MKTNKKGISLIVLVITIIVMIILATAIILSLSGSDIRGKANEAVSSTDIASAKELVAVAQSEWELDYDKLSREYDDFGEYSTKKLEKAGIDYVVVSKEGAVNIKYTDKNGDIAIIPDGFNVSTVASEQTIEDGLVIIDKDGNEFVWVPVDNMNTFKRTTTYNGTITEPDSNYVEPHSAGYHGEVEEYNEMKASVEEYKGFYIARYEAGDGAATVERTEDSGVSTVVSKKGAYVYNWVKWGDSTTNIGNTGAVYLAKKMYASSNSVVSTLCYGVQWDAALQFIATKDARYVTNGDSEKTWVGDKSGPTATGYYAVNNIYDMSGNVCEWTMEKNEDVYPVYRGDEYMMASSFGPDLRDCDIPDTTYDVTGFRVALYIK